MTTFDQTLPLAQQVFAARCHEVAAIGEIVVNRDLNGNRGFAALYSLHTRFSTIDAQEVTAVFGPLVEGMHMVIAEGRNND
ncbi:MAG TPA: hypothetical protein VF446_06775 [Trinickia sp.]